MRVGWVSALAARVPPPAAEAAARVLATLFALTNPGGARAWRANVRALGIRGKANRLAAASPFFHHLLVHYEALAMLGGRNFAVEVEGEELLERALAHGRGLLVATVHIGNWHIGGRWLHERTGRPVHTVAGIQVGRGWTRGLRLAYRRLGIRIHPRGDSAAGLLRALRAGGIVALHLDGDQHEGGGLATRGILVLARRAGVPILLAASERERVGRIRIRLIEWIDPTAPRPPSPPATRATPSAEELAARLASLIAARADQWTLFRPLRLSGGEASR